MAPTVIGSTGNPRFRQVLAAAALAGAEIDYNKDFKMADNWKTEEFLAKHPLGYLPALEDGEVNIQELGAITEYVASKGPNSTLIPSDRATLAAVRQWQWFSQTEIFIPTAYARRIFANVYPYHKGVFNAITEGLNKRLATLDAHLANSTWLVGERLTLADVFVGGALAFAFETVIPASDRKKLPNVVRFYETYVNQSKIKDIYASVTPVETLTYQPPAKPAAAEKPKAEKAPKAEKPKKKEAEDEEDDEPLVPAEPKVKNPLDDLPKSTFNLEEWKRQYSNLDTRGSGGSLEWFYKNFDHEGFSIWRVDFKYNEELTQVFMSSNQVGGFFNRLEASRKYLFGSVGVLGSANDSVISGAVIIRGQDIKPVIDVAPDWESYDYKKLDVSNEDDKAFFEGSMAWDLVINGKEWADGKNFK